MVNPFDRNFLKFFLGFVFILAASFGVLYVVGLYSSVGEPSATVIGK